jgi:hypothetical protein
MSALVGCLLPFVSLGSHAKGPINVLWGFIYGLDWYAAGLLRKIPNPTRAVIMSSLFVSLFAVLPSRVVSGSTLNDVPSYSKILSAVY